eukprot:g30031.t1
MKQRTADAGNLKRKQKLLEKLSRSGSISGERNRINLSRPQTDSEAVSLQPKHCFSPQMLPDLLSSSSTFYFCLSSRVSPDKSQLTFSGGYCRCRLDGPKGLFCTVKLSDQTCAAPCVLFLWGKSDTLTFPVFSMRILGQSDHA